jgi:hypothetical protein
VLGHSFHFLITQKKNKDVNLNTVLVAIVAACPGILLSIIFLHVYIGRSTNSNGGELPLISDNKRLG